MARSISRALEATCWALGLILVTLYFGARASGEIERRQAVATFTQTRSAMGKETSAVHDTNRSGLASHVVTDRAPDQTRWSASRIRAYASGAAKPAESAPSPAALLRIRRVEIEVPVYADATERNLNRGAGLVAGTAAPDSDGNIVIAAHRDGYFRALADVIVGDVIEVESRLQRRAYRVTHLAIVEPTDLWPLDETGVPAVTLVTCYPFYFVGSAPKRYIVRAIAVE